MQKHFLCTIYSICRQCNHRCFQIYISFLLRKCVKCLYTIHSRHHMVKKDKIVFLVYNFFQTFFSAVRLINSHLSILQKTSEHPAVYSIIINHQYICIRCYKRRFIYILLFLLFDTLGKLSNRCLIDNILLKVKEKVRAFSIGACHFQMTPHQLQKPQRNTHSKPCSLNIAMTALLDPLKFLKQLRLILFFDTDTCILYFKMQKHLLFFLLSGN